MQRLKKPRIVDTPKRVKVVGGKLEIARRVSPLSDTHKKDLEDLIEYIESGKTVPERYYRGSSDRRSDPLLALHGVMHLHLGDPSSNVLVYLIQYADVVLLICVDTHFHLKAVPLGGSLPSYAISRAEKSLDDAQEDGVEDDQQKVSDTPPPP